MRAALAALVLVLTACGSGAMATPSTPAPFAQPSGEASGEPSEEPSLPGACHIRGQLPDPLCTPGAIDPRVTQDDLAQTICRRGYTSTVRPPVSYTNPLKLQQMALYGETGPPSAYEEDHLVPLELGGHPSDPRNLWPEPGASPNDKDRVENALHSLVCSGAVPLARAQSAIASDWTTAEQTARQ